MQRPPATDRFRTGRLCRPIAGHMPGIDWREPAMSVNDENRDSEHPCLYPNGRCPLATCRARHEDWIDHVAKQRMDDEGCPNEVPPEDCQKPLCPFPDV